MDDALDGALTSIYTNNGQQCFAGSCILLQRSIADEFIQRFAERARNIRVGDPLDMATEVGPLSNAAHYARVCSFVDIARSDGGKLICGGERPPRMGEKGYYLQPTAVLMSRNDAHIRQEEIFGPFAAFQIFDTLDEAIAIANGSSFGLVSYLWSTDLREANRSAREIQAGVVLINTPMILDLRFPFGGHKDSGVGREGIDGMRHFYTEEKTVKIALQRPTMERLGARE